MDDYHGRTVLGVGEHDHMKKRLDVERHREYQEHIARKYGEPIPVWEPEAEADKAPEQSAASSVVDSDANEEEEVDNANEYGDEEALPAAVADADEGNAEAPDSVDGDAELTHAQMNQHERICAEAKENASNQDEESLSGVFGGESNWWKGTEERRRQRQQNYADDLKEQIMEQQRAKAQKKAKDDDDDRKRNEGRGHHGSFECGYYSNQSQDS